MSCVYRLSSPLGQIHNLLILGYIKYSEFNLIELTGRNVNVSNVLWNNTYS